MAPMPVYQLRVTIPVNLVLFDRTGTNPIGGHDKRPVPPTEESPGTGFAVLLLRLTIFQLLSP